MRQKPHLACSSSATINLVDRCGQYSIIMIERVVIVIITLSYRSQCEETARLFIVVVVVVMVVAVVGVIVVSGGGVCVVSGGVVCVVSISANK
jgi:hypothetical protein